MDIFEEYERELLEKARKEIAEENAKWASLSPEEKQAINKSREDRYKDIPDESDLDSDNYQEEEEED